ncbi:MAG: EthD domain-containing protein [Acidimicrobiales bacterium]|nr:EthD domain-containing protein [Acidimicrobiales bacterium]
MIRLTALLHRNPMLSHEEFLEHWHEVHGPLIRDTPELARHIIRYEQHPSTDDRGAGSGCDGVAMQWMESIDALFAFIAEPKYAEVLAPDEQRLLDMERVQVIFSEYPTVVIDGDVS